MIEKANDAPPVAQQGGTCAVGAVALPFQLDNSPPHFYCSPHAARLDYDAPSRTMAPGNAGNGIRVLIVKLSSLGDVVHSAPVVHDIGRALPGAQIDWVVEPAFAPLVRRIDGVHEVIECALRRWTRSWWTSATRTEWRAFRARLQRERYDAIIDLQGLTKSAVIARLAHGISYGLANRTEGSSHEAPARWLVDHAIRIEPRIHALDRARELAGRALAYAVHGAPVFGLCLTSSPSLDARAPTVVFVHGTSRDDKCWPDARWIELGQKFIGQGWHVALPHIGPTELARAQHVAAALGDQAEVWAETGLSDLVDRLGASQGVIGIDTGLSHIAVALGLAHVQIYNCPTSWRTAPQPRHGRANQVSVERATSPTVNEVWSAWCGAANRPLPRAPQHV